MIFAWLASLLRRRQPLPAAHHDEVERERQLRRIEQIRDAEGSAYEPGELGGAA